MAGSVNIVEGPSVDGTDFINAVNFNGETDDFNDMGEITALLRMHDIGVRLEHLVWATR